MDKAKVIVSGTKVHRPILEETLVSDDIRVAREELNETPENREIALKVFKEMLNEQNEFTPRTDDVFLLRFLRCRKFNVERAFKMIRDYYKFRHANPEVFPAPSGIEKALRAGIFTFLPHRDHKGRAIYHVKLSRWQPDKVSYNDFLAAGNLVAEYVLDNSVTQINGYIGIWDYKGFTFKHAMPFLSAKNIMKVASLMQDRFPGRFKIAYCVNCISLVNSAYSFIRPFMKEKFRNRIQILGSDIKELHQYVDPSILPAEYGGSFNMTTDNTEMMQWILDRESYYNFNRKFGY